MDPTYHWDIDPIYASGDIHRISVISEIILKYFVSEAHTEAISEILTAFSVVRHSAGFVQVLGAHPGKG